jgi:hypothetical protein
VHKYSERERKREGGKRGCGEEERMRCGKKKRKHVIPDKISNANLIRDPIFGQIRNYT